MRIILVLEATVNPNLTFLGFLCPEISFGEKMSPTHVDTSDTQLISLSVNLSA